MKSSLITDMFSENRNYMKKISSLLQIRNLFLPHRVFSTAASKVVFL